ncbi:hypothetical protein BCR39DRAFT_551500 [Naematelia encephala]|uniref:ATP-binding cassette transporter n=1 Tax=Naematelia encephala TaxID=71784 RepID=A0A1Y2AJN6_9TREE|nr:hypothetical protein BCR39DRAFT_551500 [Naematelia encephala]
MAQAPMYTHTMVLGDMQPTFYISFKKHPPAFFLRHTLFYLPLFVAASILILLLTFLIPRIYRGVRKLFAQAEYDSIAVDEDEVPPTPIIMPSGGLVSDFKAHVRSLREYGSVLFFLEIVRTLCLATLLGLSIYAAIKAEGPQESTKGELLEVLKKHKTHKHKHKNKGHKGHHDKSTIDDYSSLEIGEFGVVAFYAYSLILSLLLLTLRPATPVRRQLIAHLDILLFLAFCVYAYRDLWPLLTFYLEPSDIHNAITWSRVAILAAAAVVIPLIRPRTYVPVDPKNPTPVDQINPEQTAPWLFHVFYEFMTPLVWRAWNTPALPYDDLPPLADYDRAEHLYKLHMPNLDPIRRREQGLKPRHLYWSLLYNLRYEMFITSALCLVSAISELSGAIGINQLLEYLANTGKDATLRPIVWIALLFIGPTLGSVAIQYYIFIMTRALVRGESILTQLLFDHALRLRMKDIVPDEEDSPREEGAPEVALPLITVQDVQDHLPGQPDMLQSISENDVAAQTTGSDENGTGSGSSTEVDSTSGSKKGKTPAQKAAAEEEAQKAKGQALAGKINVLMAADVESVLEGRDVPLVFVYVPVQLVLCVVLLYRILSWSAIVGMLTMLITMPIPGLITKKNAQYQQQRMVATDDRVGAITEAVGALRMIKMFGWEGRIKERVANKREAELTLIWRRRLMTLAGALLNNILPMLTMTVTFAVYTVVQKKQLTAATVFTSMTVFDLIKGQMGMCFYMINEFVTAWVSLCRIDQFLKTSEMIDEWTEGDVTNIKSSQQLEAEEQSLIRFKNATFTWGSARGEATPGYSLRIPDLTFVKGKINLITGPTGSGKSSLLKALIGELHFVRSENSFFHLPREGGVSYADQESWCMSESIKENILFGEPYDEVRYKKTIRDCGLETDLKLFESGDATEIGEKGITLSGGQKARITLARAIYCKTAIVLLDDIFSALDTLTSRWIIDNLLKGDLIADRTVLLITHHVGLAAPVADLLVTLNEDGSLRSAGPIDEAVIAEEDIEEDIKETANDGKEDAAAPDEKKDNDKVVAKLFKAEEKGEGRISRRAMFSFFSNFGGPVFWFLYFGLLVGGQGFNAFQTWWLGRWARAFDEAQNPQQVSIPYYLGLYIVWVIIGMAMIAASSILYYLGAIKASRIIHKRLIDSIFGAYMRFLDETPIGRIISRFTKDMKSIDGPFTEVFMDVAEMTLNMIIKFIVVVSLVPMFSIPSICIGALGGVLGELYIHGQLSVKREMSNTKSPLFSHFSAAVNGIVSIRAYGAQEKLRVEARRRADVYTRAGRAYYNLNRWVTVRVDMLGGLFAASLAAFLVYGPAFDASTSGFALNQAVSFSGMILWWVRMVNEMEVQGNSVERIEDYLVIDQEPAYKQEKQPPAAWPTSGKIVLDKLSAKYTKDGPTVLDNLQLTIESGQKVGIVGRTGSGKSTLALALLRMVPTTGSVTIDGVKTENINLNALRSNVTIIPQDPILLSGSLRFNLDPFGDHDDAELNDALQSSGLGQVRHSESGSATPQRLTLDFQIAAGGGNLSQGQRQLVALARALVRSSKVLILDEATASVDFETDTLIQQSIRNLPSSTTVLTVAHRLSTVMDYDKILVLGAGKLLEFDSPEVLKNRKDSYFAKLVAAMEG